MKRAAEKAARDAEFARYQKALTPNIHWTQAISAVKEKVNNGQIACQCPYSPLGTTITVKCDHGGLFHAFFKHPSGRKNSAATFCEDHFLRERGERAEWIPMTLLSPKAIYASDQSFMYVSHTGPNQFFVVILIRLKDKKGTVTLGSAYPVDTSDPEVERSHRIKLGSCAKIWPK